MQGDRSLVSVVAHEIAHSWSGNLVSCQDCRHFWINEGFTVKLERKILTTLYGSGIEGLHAITGRQTMDRYISSVGNEHKYTSLVTKLQDGEDPDDYFSCIPYEKGYSLLSWLEYRVEQDTGKDFHGMNLVVLCHSILTIESILKLTLVLVIFLLRVLAHVFPEISISVNFFR